MLFGNSSLTCNSCQCAKPSRFTVFSGCSNKLQRSIKCIQATTRHCAVNVSETLTECPLLIQVLYWYSFSRTSTAEVRFENTVSSGVCKHHVYTSIQNHRVLQGFLLSTQNPQKQQHKKHAFFPTERVIFGFRHFRVDLFRCLQSNVTCTTERIAVSAEEPTEHVVHTCLACDASANHGR